jgi:hypothetical protein
VGTGFLLIAAGALMIWSARAYTDARADVNARFAEVMARRGYPRWYRRTLAPTGRGVRTAERRIAPALGAVVVLAGVLRLLGVWS